jgi:RIO-like serine/threonine protein kinase
MNIINMVGHVKTMGMRHGNLNPHNILIFINLWDNGVQAKLSDFSSFALNFILGPVIAAS